jgi:HlyD family secretion protein
VLAVDELDITKIRLGQKANVTSDVFKDESFTGSVSKISMEGKNQNGVTTYDVTVLLDERKALMSGMNVDIEILADNRSDTIIVPVDAIRKSNGSYMVTVRDESGNASDIEVKLGIANKNFAEVVNGINEGDIIVYGKIQNKSSSMFNGGMMSIRGGR